MIAHHRDQNLFRQGEELQIECAENHRGKFSQVYYAFKERLIFAPARSGNGARGSIESFANLMLALGASQDFRLA